MHLNKTLEESKDNSWIRMEVEHLAINKLKTNNKILVIIKISSMVTDVICLFLLVTTTIVTNS